MDKLATSTAAQIAIPAMVGLASAASRPLARGVSGATGAMYAMGTLGQKAKEEQRLKELSAMLGQTDLNEPGAWQKLMALAPNPSTLNALMSARVAQQAINKPQYRYAGSQWFRMNPSGGGAPTPVYDTSESEFQKTKRLQDLKFGYQEKLAKMNFGYNMQLTQKRDQLMRDRQAAAANLDFLMKQKAAKLPINGREAMKWLTMLDNNTKQMFLFIDQSPADFQTKKQIKADLIKQLQSEKARYQSLIDEISPNAGNPLNLVQPTGNQ
jgi:hypothetical protein